MNTASIRPLEGLRVLDLTRVLSGPMGCMMLADLGAEVIRVEDMEGSDVTRHNHPFLNGESHYYLSVNRNKLALAVDLKHPEGRRIVRELALQSDVVVENFRPGVADRLGLGYKALAEANPRIIYASISAFGQNGPWRDKIAYDLVVQAVTGAMAITGEPGRPPVKMGLPLADEMSGLFMAIGVLAALERRERSGRGCCLDVGMYDVGIALLSYIANIYFATGKSAPPQGSSHPTIYPYNAFRTRDGYVVVAPFTQAFWRKYCTVIGREDLANHPHYRNFAERLAHRAELAAILEPLMAAKTTGEWLVALEAGDVPNGPVNSVAEALEMEQTRARGMVTDVDHPVCGRFRSLGTPFHFDFEGRPFVPVFRYAPLLGEHTAAILRGRLGYDEAKIAALVAQKVVRVAEPPPGVPPPVVAAAPRPPVPVVPETAGDDAAPLAGLRVIDLTRMFAGPYGSLILADLGGEVIKIEEPRIGDPTRRNLPMIGDESSYFLAINRGKKSMTLDLKAAGGREVLLDLVRHADVVIENYRPGVMERLGLGYADLRQVNPHVILCSISGFGQTGPLKDKISFDLVNQAIAGTMAVTGEEGRPPVRIGLPVGDLNGGIFGALGILAALRNRRVTGVGAHIDLGLHDTLVALLGYLAQLYFISGESAGPVGSGHHHIAPYRAFETSDGHIVIAAFSQDFWLKFARVIGHPELAEDPRFRTLTDRKLNRDALHAIIEPVLRTRTAAQWTEAFEHGDVPNALVASVGQCLESEQAKARGLVFEYDHPTIGRQRSVGTPLAADGTAWRTATAPPTLGQHTHDLLAGLLGYTPARIDALRAAHVIG